MNRKLTTAYTLVVLAVVLTALFGGTVATAYASQGALPGSPLHPVKTGLERAQLALSPSAARDASLNLRFAERRLEELAGLIQAGRFSELAPVVSAFEAHLQAALEGLQSVSQSDPAAAQQLAAAITAALSRYAELLMQLSAAVPSEAQAPLQQALQLSTQGFQIELVGLVRSMGTASWEIERLSDGTPVEIGVNQNTEVKPGVALDSLVKVEAIQDSTGMLWAVEIELAGQDLGDDNANTNENDNEDVGGNENEAPDANENEAAGGNENEALGGNENEGAGENENANANENENDNDNEHGGEVRLVGTVTAMNPASWAIAPQGGGAAVLVGIDADTELEAGIDIGALVEIKAIQDSSGTLVAVEIKLAGEDETDDNANENENENVNENDNENENNNDNGNDNGNDNDD